MSRPGWSDFEADVNAVDGNVSLEMRFNEELRVKFTVTPAKARAFADAITYTCDIAERQLPSLES